MHGREELEKQGIAIEGWYFADEANKVMDAMEARIKELETKLNDKEQCCKWCSNDARIEGLHKRIAELEAVISKMETTTPKWISVKDRLPNENEQHKLLWVGHVRKDNTIKYMYEASFDYDKEQFYTENEWGDKTFVEPSIWMVVPPPPTTEEK